MIVDCVCLPFCVFSTKNKHLTVHTQHTSYSFSVFVLFYCLVVYFVVVCFVFVLFLAVHVFLLHLSLVKLRMH